MHLIDLLSFIGGVVLENTRIINPEISLANVGNKLHGIRRV